MDGIFKLLSSKDEEIVSSGLESLIEICQINYIHMSNYLTQIFDAIKNIVDDQNLEESQAYAIEIWTTLLEKEEEHLNDMNVCEK